MATQAQALVRDIARHSASEFPSLIQKPSRNNKRHAIYIPQSFFEKARQAIAEAEAEAASTWEFSAAISPSTTTVSSTESSSSSSAASSPAQEIVIRYRAGMPIRFDASSETRSELSSDDEESEEDGSLMFYGPVESTGDTGQSSTETRVNEVEDTEIKLIYRQSCHQGLQKAREEAFQVMHTHGLREADSITCQRSRCSDTLRSASDLMFHIHIHDIHDSLVSCSRCHHLYENQEDLGMHQCTGARVRSFVTPLKSILTRLLSKFAHHK